MVLLITVCAVVLLIQYNYDKVKYLLEKFADGFVNWSISFVNWSISFVNWSVQSSSIQDLLVDLKNGIFLVQNTLLIIDFIGLFGFIRAINSGSYQFALTIFWIGICGKIASVFVKPKYKKYYSFLLSIIQLVISIQFNSSMSILSYSCKLVSLLVVDLLLSKIKYILLKVGFFAIVGTEEINEDSIQSTITNFLTNMENKLLQVNENKYQLKQTIILICENMSSKIDETLLTVNEFHLDIKNRSKLLYYFKLMKICIMIYYFNPPIIYYFISILVRLTLIVKIFENIVEPLTALDSMLDNSFEVLNIKCSKLKILCLKTRVGISLLSFAHKRLNKY